MTRLYISSHNMSSEKNDFGFYHLTRSLPRQKKTQSLWSSTSLFLSWRLGPQITHRDHQNNSAAFEFLMAPKLPFSKKSELALLSTVASAVQSLKDQPAQVCTLQTAVKCPACPGIVATVVSRNLHCFPGST